MPFFHVARADRHERRVQQAMTTEISQRDEPPADLLATANHIYTEAAEALGKAIREVAIPDAGDTKAVLLAVREMKQAFHTLMEERTKVEKLRKQLDGVVGNHALDLDAARDEIGRRLACLRDAGNSG